jgi:hypothetical protein
MSNFLLCKRTEKELLDKDFKKNYNRWDYRDYKNDNYITVLNNDKKIILLCDYTKEIKDMLDWLTKEPKKDER